MKNFGQSAVCAGIQPCAREDRMAKMHMLHQFGFSRPQGRLFQPISSVSRDTYHLNTRNR